MEFMPNGCTCRSLTLDHLPAPRSDRAPFAERIRRVRQGFDDPAAKSGRRPRTSDLR
jgi:hypothetical protein